MIAMGKDTLALFVCASYMWIAILVPKIREACFWAALRRRQERADGFAAAPAGGA